MTHLKLLNVDNVDPQAEFTPVHTPFAMGMVGGKV